MLVKARKWSALRSSRRWRRRPPANQAMVRLYGITTLDGVLFKPVIAATRGRWTVMTYREQPLGRLRLLAVSYLLPRTPLSRPYT